MAAAPGLGLELSLQKKGPPSGGLGAPGGRGEGSRAFPHSLRTLPESSSCGKWMSQPAALHTHCTYIAHSLHTHCTHCLSSMGFSREEDRLMGGSSGPVAAPQLPPLCNGSDKESICCVLAHSGWWRHAAEVWADLEATSHSPAPSPSSSILLVNQNSPFPPSHCALLSSGTWGGISR